jgi:hypothetical protein
MSTSEEMLLLCTVLLTLGDDNSCSSVVEELIFVTERTTQFV